MLVSTGCAPHADGVANEASVTRPAATAEAGPGDPGRPDASDAGEASREADADAATADAASPVAPAPPDGMLLVPGGTFTMGAASGGQEDEHPAHAVTVRPFFLDRTEVTNAAYDACVQAHACKPNARTLASLTHAGDDARFHRPAQPVNGVTWFDATAYCAWRGGARLPTEAEFERAIRDDDGRRFPWGNEPPTPERTVFGRPLSTGATDDVGAHPSGRGPYGHDDLAGNLWEWTADDYDPYAYRRPGAPEGKPGACDEILATQDELRRTHQDGFTGSNPIPRECERVLRGGAFNYDADGLRSTNRVHHPAKYRLVMAGLRCAKSAR